MFSQIIFDLAGFLLDHSVQSTHSVFGVLSITVPCICAGEVGKFWMHLLFLFSCFFCMLRADNQPEWKYSVASMQIFLTHVCFPVMFALHLGITYLLNLLSLSGLDPWLCCKWRISTRCNNINRLNRHQPCTLKLNWKVLLFSQHPLQMELHCCQQSRWEVEGWGQEKPRWRSGTK